MQTIWMQRYLDGHFAGTVRKAVPRAGRVEVGVHACPNPAYVCAKINSLQKLPRAR